MIIHYANLKLTQQINLHFRRMFLTLRTTDNKAAMLCVYITNESKQVSLK